MATLVSSPIHKATFSRLFNVRGSGSVYARSRQQAVTKLSVQAIPDWESCKQKKLKSIST